MTEQDVIDMEIFMNGVLQLHYSNGYLNPKVVLTKYMWDKVIELWPNIYFGTMRTRKKSFIDRILRRKPRRLWMCPNAEWLETIRESWKDSKTFMLNGYVMQVEVV